jgi:signal transduction histidine kinase/DNA-binding response OmpR family regulator
VRAEEGGPDKGRILVVDDNPENMRLLMNILSARGYTVHPATEGAIALRFVESVLPDVVLLDIAMPDMDGYQVCERLKADARTRDIPVLFISGGSQILDKVRAFAIGGVDYIVKPFEPDEVVGRVETHLALRSLQLRLEQRVEARTRELLEANARLRAEIAERERAEAAEAALRRAVEEAAADWELTFDAMEMPVLLLDRDGCVRRLNRAGREVASRPAENLTGRPLADIAKDEPWHTASALAIDVRRLRALQHKQIRHVTSGKTWEVIASPAPHFAGPDGVIVVAHDITSMVQLQKQLRRSETMSALGMLVAGVAHEVRNPLFSISANLDAFEAVLGPRPEHADAFANLRVGVDQLARLMQDLLDFGRPGSAQPKRGMLQDVIAESAAACAALATSRGVRLENRAPAGPPAEIEDRDRLVQVVQNLLQNAIQHTPAGGLVVVEATERPHEAAPRAVVTVSDRGPGFAPDDLPHVFEPFFTRRRGGTGLGLAIVQKIVEELGGTVSATNGAEGGARMVVEVPTAPLSVDARP